MSYRCGNCGNWHPDDGGCPEPLRSQYERGVRDTLNKLTRAVQIVNERAPDNSVDVLAWCAQQREKLA